MFFTKKLSLITILFFTFHSLNGDKQYPLHEAVREGNVKKINTLISKKYNLAQPNKKTETALHLAIKKNKHKCAYTLMRHALDIDATTVKEQTPLHFAAKYNPHFYIAKQLLHYDADLEAEDYKGRTPLHLAAKHSNPSLVKFFLQRGANRYAYDFIGQRPIDLAKTKEENHEVITLLKQKV